MTSSNFGVGKLIFPGAINSLIILTWTVMIYRFHIYIFTGKHNYLEINLYSIEQTRKFFPIVLKIMISSLIEIFALIFMKHCKMEI